MLQPSVLAVRFIGGGELLVTQFAKSLVLASVIVHPAAVGAVIHEGCPELTNIGAASLIAQMRNQARERVGGGKKELHSLVTGQLETDAALELC